MTREELQRKEQELRARAASAEFIGKRPRKPGVVVGGDSDSFLYNLDDAARPVRPPYEKLCYSSLQSLAEMSQHFQFFSHAALFVYGNLTKDPVQDFLVEYPSARPFWLEFPQPIFSGLFYRARGGKTVREWGYRLMGIEKQFWPELHDYLGQIVAVSPTEGRYLRTVLQAMPMVDYLTLWRSATLPKPLPMFEVVLIGVDGNDRGVAYEPAKNPPNDHVHVRFFPADPATVKIGEELLRGNNASLMVPPVTT